VVLVGAIAVNFAQLGWVDMRVVPCVLANLLDSLGFTESRVDCGVRFEALLAGHFYYLYLSSKLTSCLQYFLWVGSFSNMNDATGCME